jgi:hypothetical protein
VPYVAPGGAENQGPHLLRFCYLEKGVDVGSCRSGFVYIFRQDADVQASQLGLLDLEKPRLYKPKDKKV